jgi:hypothetical protein
VGVNDGGSGGKGVVILRTLDTVATASVTVGTTTYSTGIIVYTFNDSGTIVWL